MQIGDEHLFFVTRSNSAEGVSYALDPQTSSWLSEIAISKLRHNGLVSLDAPYSSASDAALLQTRPLVFSGTRLLLNLDSSGGGSLSVEVRHAESSGEWPALLSSMPISANGVELEVFWNGTPTSGGNATAVAAFEGVPIVLTMHMMDCELYSFRFAL